MTKAESIEQSNLSQIAAHITPDFKLSTRVKELQSIVLSSIDAYQEARHRFSREERLAYDETHSIDEKAKLALENLKREIRNTKRKMLENKFQYFAQLYQEMLGGISQGFSFSLPQYFHGTPLSDLMEPYPIRCRTPTHTKTNRIVTVEQNPIDGQYRIPISFCENSKTISIGNASFQRPYVNFTPEEDYHVKNIILKGNGLLTLEIVDPDVDFPLNNKISSAILRPRFNQLFRLLNFRIWVGDDKELIKRFCNVEGKLSNGLISRFHRYRTFIIKAAKNNEQQLIPAIMYYGTDIGDLKRGLGHLWKCIYRNSPSRNHLIFGHLHMFGEHDIKAHDHGVKFTKTGRFLIKHNSFYDSADKLALLQKMPSSILKRVGIFKDIISRKPNNEDIISQFSFIVWSSDLLTPLKKITNHDRLKDYLGIVRDTHRMAERLQLPFSFQWSYRRMQREHHNYTLEYHSQQHEYVEYKFKYPWPEIIECGNGITARLITSNQMLFLEGQEMHHCVASYHEFVLDGYSLIYSLINHEETRSTLEIQFRGSGKKNEAYSAQNRSKWNQQVEKPFNDAAEFCVTAINNVLTLTRK